MMCVFCDIINRRADAYIVSETDHTITILDIEPINEGHVLVIPKIHEATLSKIPSEIAAIIMEEAQKIVRVYEEAFDADGYSIMQNGGAFCDFGHFHFHVFPRFKNDGFGWKYPEGSFEYSKEVADRIKGQIQS